MKEYLFFQDHKRFLDKNENSLSQKSLTRTSDNTKSQTQLYRAYLDEIDRKSKPEESKKKRPKTVFSDETIKKDYDKISATYEEQYISAGFPPKICALMVSKLCTLNRYKCQILDVGCGKGFVGEYLKNDGFFRISGMDCSKNLLKISESKKVYEKLERVVFGQEDSVIGESHHEKYDFVIAASMINNNDCDKQMFLDLLSCLKIGGFAIFATKLNFHQENQYDSEIKNLVDENYWQYVSEHTFYRYDKLCGGVGKFSTKLVKVFAYQKTDHETWAKENEIKRLAEEVRKKAIQAEKDKADAERKAKEDAKAARANKGKAKDAKKK